MLECYDEHDEALKVVNEIQTTGVPLNQCAVFYRTNALSRVLEDAFRGAGIPYTIARGTA